MVYRGDIKIYKENAYFLKMPIYSFRKVGNKRQRVWKWSRRRGLEQTKESIGEILPDARRILDGKPRIRALEVGCGYGRALLELKRELKAQVETYGINKEPKWSLRLIRQFGLAERIFSKDEIDQNLPKLSILDAGKELPFPSNYFDIVFSHHSVQYVHDKALLLEEINRILSPEGIARIQVQARKPEYPIEYQHLLEIWDKKGKRIDFADYIKKFPNISLEHTHKGVPYILMRKAKKLDLSLSLVVSFDLNKLNPDWWGTKAVYVIR
jgi:SAM-dependent methyltransferase